MRTALRDAEELLVMAERRKVPSLFFFRFVLVKRFGSKCWLGVEIVQGVAVNGKERGAWRGFCWEVREEVRMYVRK